jgi:opacity protein-like surface antigen
MKKLFALLLAAAFTSSVAAAQATPSGERQGKPTTTQKNGAQKEAKAHKREAKSTKKAAKTEGKEMKAGEKK